MVQKENKLVYGESFTKEKFKNPSKEFGIMPFWFVNGEMDHDEMEWQLEQFAEKGIPGIFFHPRFGIKDYMTYLGDEWLERYRFTADKCKKLGMQSWIYDEYNWPSGTCNQEIMAENPELTSRYLQLVVNDIPGQFFVYMEGTDSRYNDLEQSEPVYACAILEEDLKNGRDQAVNLMPNLAFDKVISWEAPKGPWKLCYFVERKASWYSDVLNEKTTQEFIHKTYQKYSDHVDGSIAQNAGGFFTDEPAMLYFEDGANNMVIPWSAHMFKIFKEINGYDLKPHLPKLYFEIGDYHKVRHDFWSALSKQYEKAYYQQIHDWCKEHDVVFTGHLLHEEFIRCHAKTGGNLFHMLKNLDMTGIDHLYPRIGTREMPAEHVALKIASSAAHQNNSTRLICESMGGSYWDCTMERMKWIADWEYVLGVNIFTPHGFHYSIEGERKRDWPPSQFYHHTWWKYYGDFNNYLKRMGYLLSGGHHVAKAGVLYPINNIWANYTPQCADAASDLCEKDYVYMTDRLLRLHYDYDYIDEDMMRKMTLKDGKFMINGEEYSLIILPPVTQIKEHTLTLLKQFYDEGGKIIGDALLPEGILEPEGKTNIDTVIDIFGIDPLVNNRRCLLGEPVECSLIENGNANGGKAVMICGSGLHTCDGMAFLGEAIGRLIEWDVQIDSEEIFYLHRVKDGIDFYFLINPTSETIDAKVSIRTDKKPQYYDLLTGEIRDITVFEQFEDCTVFRHTFPAYGSAMFGTSGHDCVHAVDADMEILQIDGVSIKGYNRSGSGYVVLPDGSKKQSGTKDVLPEIPLDITFDFQTDIDNALLIRQWKFNMADRVPDDFYRPEYDHSGHGWLDYTMGGWELQLPYERDEKTYPVDIVYKAFFQTEYIPSDIKILIDGFKCSSYTMWINGTEIKEKGTRSFLDSEIRQILIADYLLVGSNDISIRMTVEKPLHGLLDFIKITGGFSVFDDIITAPVKRMEPGSWTLQGYPYFSGTGSYTCQIDIPEQYLDERFLTMRIDCHRDVARVYVNGKETDVMLWEPYETEIGHLLTSGKNEIRIEVTNTLINLLEAKTQESGLFHASIVPYNIHTLSL